MRSRRNDLIQHFLAYGHADQDFFRGQTDLYDGLTIPGTIAAFYQQGTGGFVLAQHKPYFIDPRTPVFQIAPGQLRKSHWALASIHGATVRKKVETGSLDPTSLTPEQLREMTVAVLQFQETFAQKSTQKIDKYLKMIGQESAGGNFNAPAWLVPPYFYDPSVRGANYGVSLDIARMAQAENGGERVHPIACVDKRALSTAGSDVNNLIDDYAPFSQTILFFSVFEEANASEPQLQGFWNLVRGLSGRGRPPFMLFGGYFSILAHYVGLAGFSHGIGYGESRNALSPVSGPPGKRFYIPALRRFFTVAEAEYLIAADRKERGLFQCVCGPCEAARAAGRGALDRRTREDIFHHFLRVRHDEVMSIQIRKLTDLVADLRDVHNYATSIARGFANKLTYLARWANAIQTA